MRGNPIGVPVSTQWLPFGPQLTALAAPPLVAYTTGRQPSSTPSNVQGNDLSVPSTPSNPFLPPPIKAALLKKFEKAEFTDFEDLINNRSGRCGSRGSRGVRFVFDETLEAGEDGLGGLRAQYEGGDGIMATFTNWLSAWNIFVQETLYFRPKLFFELFSYQKNYHQRCESPPIRRGIQIRHRMSPSNGSTSLAALRTSVSALGPIHHPDS